MSFYVLSFRFLPNDIHFRIAMSPWMDVLGYICPLTRYHPQVRLEVREARRVYGRRLRQGHHEVHQGVAQAGEHLDKGVGRPHGIC